MKPKLRHCTHGWYVRYKGVSYPNNNYMKNAWIDFIKISKNCDIPEGNINNSKEEKSDLRQGAGCTFF